MNKKIVIIDYGLGNHFSVERKLEGLGSDIVITNDLREIKSASKIILPGVGHFAKAMENLKDLNLIEALTEEVMIKKKPILGICLGMQLMAEYSEEGDVKGLGWIDAKVERFKVENQLKYKVPHTGWNQLEIVKGSKLLNNIDNLAEFYFVHTYYFNCNKEEDKLTLTNYESKFVSAISQGNIFGVQFHPEKSHNVGIQLLKNFVEL